MTARIAMIAYTCYNRDPRVRREAEALVAAGYAVRVFALRDVGDPPSDVVNGVEVIRAPLGRSRAGRAVYALRYGLFFLMAFAWLTAQTAGRFPRVVHVHNLPNFLVFAALAPRLLGARVILDVHDPVPELYQSKFKAAYDAWPVRLLRFEERLSTWFAHHVVTVSQPVAVALRRRGLPPEKLTVVMNAPDTDLFTRNGMSAVADNGHGPVLVYTGVVAPRQGLDVAIEGLGIIRQRHPGARLRIVGDGDGSAALQSLAERMGVSEAVSFERPMPLDDVPALLMTADVGISTPRGDPFMDLVFSTKVLEYLSMGLPAVCAGTACMQHYLGKGDAVDFFTHGDPADFARSVERALSRTSGAEERSQAVQAFMDRHGWPVQRTRYLALVARLTGHDMPVETVTAQGSAGMKTPRP